jgi:hypothetical protein
VALAGCRGRGRSRAAVAAARATSAPAPGARTPGMGRSPEGAAALRARRAQAGARASVARRARSLARAAAARRARALARASEARRAQAGARARPTSASGRVRPAIRCLARPSGPGEPSAGHRSATPGQGVGPAAPGPGRSSMRCRRAARPGHDSHHRRGWSGASTHQQYHCPDRPDVSPRGTRHRCRGAGVPVALPGPCRHARVRRRPAAETSRVGPVLRPLTSGQDRVAPCRARSRRGPRRGR